MNTRTLNAIAEPNRLRIIELLRESPSPVGEIASRLKLRQPQVSKHLRLLSEAGLVRARPNAQQRIYFLQAEPFKELNRWLETFRKTWENRLDNLDEYMQELKEEKRNKKEQNSD